MVRPVTNTRGIHHDKNLKFMKSKVLRQKITTLITSCGIIYASFGFLLLPKIVRYAVVKKVSPP